jgi:hypothetical protein
MREGGKTSFRLILISIFKFHLGWEIVLVRDVYHEGRKVEGYSAIRTKRGMTTPCIIISFRLKFE